MIHYAYNFCAAVEHLQDVNENLVEATKRVAEAMNTDLLLKVRDSLRELARTLETIAIERQDG